MKSRYEFPRIPSPMPPWKVWENIQKAKQEKRKSDHRHLELLVHKDNAKEPFSKEDLRFLYEIDSSMTCFRDDQTHFDWTRYFRRGRNIKKDIAEVLGIQEKEVGISGEDPWSEEYKIYTERIHGDQVTNIEYGALPEVVCDDVYLWNLKSVGTLILPRRINGDLSLLRLANIKGVIFPEYVGGSIKLSRDVTLEEQLMLPKEVGGSMEVSCRDSEYKIIFPEKVGGDCSLDCVTSAKNIVFPKIVGGKLRLIFLKNTKGLVLPEYIGGDLDLHVPSLDGLDLMENLQNAHKVFFDRTPSRGLLNMPLYIGGNIILRGLRTLEGLIPPERFQGKVIFERMSPANIRKFKKQYPDITVVTQKGYGNETEETVW